MNKRVVNKTDVKSSNDKRIYRSIRVIIGIPRCIANSLRSSLVRDVMTEISLSILRLSVMRINDEESHEIYWSVYSSHDCLIAIITFAGSEIITYQTLLWNRDSINALLADKYIFLASLCPTKLPFEIYNDTEINIRILKITRKRNQF